MPFRRRHAWIIHVFAKPYSFSIAMPFVISFQ